MALYAVLVVLTLVVVPSALFNLGGVNAALGYAAGLVTLSAGAWVARAYEDRR